MSIQNHGLKKYSNYQPIIKHCTADHKHKGTNINQYQRSVQKRTLINADQIQTKVKAWDMISNLAKKNCKAVQFN